jgi:signal transduction histidine kinase
MIILRDISDIVKIEYARSVEKMSDIMIASTSHDMRTPLNTIINMHNMITKLIGDPKILKFLRVATSSTNLLLYLVNDTLDYYQIKSNKFKKRMAAFRVDEVIQTCLNLVSIQMEQKGLGLIV